MDLLGITFDNESIKIKVEDCPIKIDNNTIVLLNKNNSPLVYAYSIRRCTDAVEEFSYVFDNNSSFIGYVIYKDSSFKIYNPYNDNWSELKNEYTYRKCTNVNIMRKLEKISDEIKFSVDGKWYQLRKIVSSTKNGDLVIFNNKNHQELSIKNMEVIYG